MGVCGCVSSWWAHARAEVEGVSFVLDEIFCVSMGVRGRGKRK